MRTAPPPSSPKHAVRIALLVAALISAGLVSLSRVEDAAAAVGDPVIVAAGDIACPTTDPSYNGGEGTATQCRQKHTSDMILDADQVLVLGDAQYATGSLSQYRAVYDPRLGSEEVGHQLRHRGTTTTNREVRRGTSPTGECRSTTRSTSAPGTGCR